MQTAIKFSMSSLFIEDSTNKDSPERKFEHSLQGFSKTSSCIQCDMLGDWGVANIWYSETYLLEMSNSERILALPLFLPSRVCRISSPDYGAVDFQLTGEHFCLTIGQTLVKDSNGPEPAEVNLLLYFEPVLDSSIISSKVLKKDSRLNPPRILL